MHYKGETHMGIDKKMIMGFYLIIITFLCLFASSSNTPLDDQHEPFLSDPLQENNLGATGAHEHGINSFDDDSNGRTGIVHSSKSAHRSVYRGARGGGAGGAADNANGGGDTQGGGAVVPVIIAGAANNHRPNNHHNAGSRHGNFIVLPTFITATLAALIVH